MHPLQNKYIINQIKLINSVQINFHTNNPITQNVLLINDFPLLLILFSYFVRIVDDNFGIKEKKACPRE